MRRVMVAALCAVSAIGGLVLPGGLGATERALPGGTSISVEIDPQFDGAFVEAGSAITGTASVGAGVPQKDTTLVYALDVSGSTQNSSGVSCGTILACEIAGVGLVDGLASASTSPVANTGVAVFPDRSGFPLGLQAPGSLSTALGSLTAAGGTDFGLGLEKAGELFTSSEEPKKILVFLTDGAGTNVPTSLGYTAVIKAFAIGGTGCSSSLMAVAALGAPGSSCQVVNNLDQLGPVIGQSVGSTLESVVVTVDGPATTVPATVTPTPPVGGPIVVTFTATLPAGLSPGAHQVCATASGKDALGPDSVTDCVTVNVAQATIDCGATAGTCTETVTDPGVATAVFAAPPEFDKVVGINANTDLPGECGGANCITGFDVLFDDTGSSVVAELTVTTAKPTTLRQRLEAAVYINGVKVTKICGGPIVARLRELSGTPQPVPCRDIRVVSGLRLEYYVRFDADPGFRFR